MNETEFNSNKDRILASLRFAIDNPHSDFYRKKYSGLNIVPENINTYADFQKIPYLTKEEILAVPLKERLFVPEAEITGYSISSGTTGINSPLVTPRIKDDPFEYSQNACLVRDGVRKAMLLLPIALTATKSRQIKVPCITGDVHKLIMSAKIAKSLAIDALITTPTILYLFTEQLLNESVDLKKIKHLTISTEYCTKQKATYFKKMFPNASIRYNYGSTEIGGVVGYRCEYISNLDPYVFHLRDSNLMEIEPPKNSKTTDYGEIICTHLTNKAFPLIRYKTGDIADIEKYDCACGQQHIIKLRGRANFDVFRISGGLIHTQLIANAISSVAESVKPMFQIHVYEKSHEGKLLTKLVLKLVPLDKSLIGSEGQIARIIQSNLYLAANKSLDDFVNEKIFLPLSVEFVNELPEGAKSKNIISHIE